MLAASYCQQTIAMARKTKLHRTGRVLTRMRERECPIAHPRAKGTVKSAGRVLQIFEFFDEIQREARVAEIAERLAFPQSSTSILLKCLVDLGYLDYLPEARSFLPSPVQKKETPEQGVTLVTGQTLMLSRQSIDAPRVHDRPKVREGDGRWRLFCDDRKFWNIHLPTADIP
jgi:hypothetical protein